MSHSTDMAAMRTAIENIEGLETFPADLHSLFVHSDAAIALAVEVALAGGRLPLPSNAGHEWVDLLSSGHLHFGFGALRGWVEIDAELLTEFLGGAA
jgi:hypothetical protein